MILHMLAKTVSPKFECLLVVEFPTKNNPQENFSPGTAGERGQNV